ncbi:MAG: hypothetical protein P1U34_05815 [Coxiellaceae bacterium]|nr:hypothetical protein [Coxiellaceae bacterium]
MPDCSAVSDDALSNYVLGLWQFPQAIKYSFFGDLTGEQAAHLLTDSGFQPPFNSSVVFREKIDHAMQYWQYISDGVMRLEKVDYLSADQPGILFANCGSLQQFEAIQRHGFAQTWYDSAAKFFHRVLVCLPEGMIETDDPHWEYVKNHEIGHALGGDHMHMGDVGELLKQIPQGAGCSVMAYPEVVTTATSLCLPENCPAGYATTPGQLDRRFFKAAYDPENGWLPKQVEQQVSAEIHYAGTSVLSICVLMFASSVMKKGLERFVVNREYDPKDELTQQDRRKILAMSDLVVDLSLGIAARLLNVANVRDHHYLDGFLFVRCAATVLQLSKRKSLQKIGNALKGEHLWHGFFGLLVMQQHLVAGGVAELANGLFHGVAGVVGTSAIDSMATLFHKSPRQPVLPVTAHAKSPRARL